MCWRSTRTAPRWWTASSDSYVFVDGLGVGGDGAGGASRSGRRWRSNGFLVVTVGSTSTPAALVGEPQIVTRGFVYEGEADDLLERAKAEVDQSGRAGAARAPS